MSPPTIAAQFTRSAARPRSRPHLRAAVIVTGIFTLVYLLVERWCLSLEDTYIDVYAQENSVLKDGGVAWQRAAFARSTLLPLFGSSELLKNVGTEANQLFANYPSGFSVSPAGRAGATSIIQLQMIAASGAGSRRHKLAVLISPSWFFHRTAPERWYAGSFSMIQANEIVFSTPLSLGLRREIARRMLDYPDTLEHSPLLSFALRRLSANSLVDTALYQASKPLGWLARKVFLLQDHVRIATYFRRHARQTAPNRGLGSLNWPSLLAAAETEAAEAPTPPEDRKPRYKSDEAFEQIQEAGEWRDLELLLRVCKELDLDLLLVNIPLDASYYERAGVSKAMLDTYVQHLRGLASNYGAALVDNADHEEDTDFLQDHFDHLSPKGWLYIDRDLEKFFHTPSR